MNALYTIGSIVSIVILGYLFVAMLKPEWF